MNTNETENPQKEEDAEQAPSMKPMLWDASKFHPPHYEEAPISDSRLVSEAPSADWLADETVVNCYSRLCSKGHEVRSYHPIENPDKLCSKCNDPSKRTKRVRGTLRDEFAFEFVVAKKEDITWDDFGRMVQIGPPKQRAIIRSLVAVKRKWRLLGPYLVSTVIDPEDREFKDKVVLCTYLLRHGRRVAWSDTRDDPIELTGGDEGGFYAPSFEYHPSEKAEEERSG